MDSGYAAVLLVITNKVFVPAVFFYARSPARRTNYNNIRALFCGSLVHVRPLVYIPYGRLLIYEQSA